MSLLNITDVGKSVGNSVIFPEFSLEVQKGEVIAFQCNAEVGNSFIQIMIGNIPTSSGEIIFEGVSLPNHFKKLSKQIGIVLLHDGLYERLTPNEYLHFFKNLYEVHINLDELLHTFGFSEKKFTKIRNLSFSEKRRLQFARAIIHNPNLILLEEPDQNLDIESKLILKRLIDEWASQGKTIILTTNNLESAILLANKVYRLNDLECKKIEIMDDEEPLEAESEQIEADSTQEDIAPTQDDNTEIPLQTQIRFSKIPAKVDEKIILFDPTEIDYIESNEGVSHLHVKGEVFPCSYTLNELFDRLQFFGFFRCHRSYIVNLQKVREVITWTRNSYSLILEDSKKSSIPLSKGKVNELKEIIGI